MTRSLDELANHCFGCGEENPEGLHLRFTVESPAPGEAIARAEVNLTRRHEGPPGYIHGGILATLLDEAMSKLNRPLHLLAMTRHLEVDYLRPAELGATHMLEARTLRREGRKLFHQATLTHADGTVLTRGKGLFLVIDRARFDIDRARFDPA